MSEDSPFVEVEAEALKRVEGLERDAKELIRNSIATFGVGAIGVPFNGGKDCIVALHLVQAVCALSDCVTFNLQDQRPQLDEMIAYRGKAKEHFLSGVSVREVVCQNYKEGLEQLHADGVRAVVMGTRRSALDPGAEFLGPQTMCSEGWPQVMRVNPILEWEGRDVWAYIHHHRVPYCSLYAQGYTSLGDRDNTLPNPELKDEASPGGYLPAWELKQDTLERSGRLKSKPEAPKGEVAGAGE